MSLKLITVLYWIFLASFFLDYHNEIIIKEIKLWHLIKHVFLLLRKNATDCAYRTIFKCGLSGAVRGVLQAI